MVIEIKFFFILSFNFCSIIEFICFLKYFIDKLMIILIEGSKVNVIVKILFGVVLVKIV